MCLPSLSVVLLLPLIGAGTTGFAAPSMNAGYGDSENSNAETLDKLLI